MIEWFNSREPLERILLMIMFGLMLVFAIWFLMTRETGPDPDQQLAEAQSDRELWLRAKPRLLTKGQGDIVRKEFNRGELINLARQRDVRLTRVEPQNDGNLSVWIDDISTNSLYGLFTALNQSYQVDFTNVTISRTPQGSLNAQFTLSGA